MAGDDHDASRRALLETLLDTVQADPYPSSTMLDLVESMLKPDEVPAYADVLLDKVRNDRFPSIPMLSRIQNLC